MSRIPVAELQVQSQGQALVRATSSAPSSNLARSQSRDLREWTHRSGVSAKAMMLTGLGLATVGAAGALLLHSGFLGMVALTSMFSTGAGLVFLGALKRRGPAPEPEAEPPAPTTSAAVSAERARRVLAVLDREGEQTFERLLAMLRWTEPALLETLVAMKESNQIIEDLDLEAGEWVYRSAVSGYGHSAAGGAMTLSDRQAQGLHTGTGA